MQENFCRGKAIQPGCDQIHVKGYEPNLELLAADDGYLPDKCCLGLLGSFGSAGIAQFSKEGSTQKLHLVLQLGDVPHKIKVTLDLGDEADKERLARQRTAKRIQAATKADDAEIPWELWDARLLPHMDPEDRPKVLSPLREFLLLRWRRNI
jgi:hypothetical protein